MLSEAIAKRFVEETLQVPDVASRLSTGRGAQRLQVLNDLCRAFLNHVPFHNLGLIALPVKDRKIPSMEESIKHCLSGEGGLCWSLNYFFYKLLQALGFDVFPILGSMFEPDTNDHLIVGVGDVANEGDRYIVDVGNAEPNFQAMSLDFEEESQEYQNSFRTSKLVKKGGDFYVKMQKSSGKWKAACFFYNKATALSAVQESIDRAIYTNLECNFNNGLSFVVFDGDLAFCLKNNVWLKEDDQRKLQPSEVESDQQVVERISSWVPRIPLDVVKNAVKNARKTSESWAASPVALD